MTKNSPDLGSIRIVGGRWRGRKLAAPGDQSIRPTGERQRESLFNILAHGRYAPGGVSMLQRAAVLDIFAGTGALGLEALSRGAANCLFLDNGAHARRLIEANIAACKAQGVARLVPGDATNLTAPPPAPWTQATLAFLDPPYGEGLGERALASLAAKAWLAPDAVCVVETGERDDFAAPARFVLEDERRYGKSNFRFFRFQ
jgi:16S rRNA (guanine966-N2)-methyltransferase